MTSTSRIAKNTLFLYFRQILIMLVSLYTVRVVLATLGAEDYGIYNVVAGVVVLFSFVNNAMASGTQRFLNYSLGEKNIEKTRSVYSTSLVVHVAIAVLFVVAAETIGLWFVSKKLNVPSARHSAAMTVYQLAVVTTVLNIIKVPYNAVIIAYEKMSFFAGISIIEAILKLAVVFMLSVSAIDKLVMYAILLTVVAGVILLCYKLYCNKNFDAAHFRCPKDISLVKEILSFSGWSLFGASADMCNQQGTNIVLNMFTNVTVNAAMGIANQVNSALYSFVGNFQTAFKPQIVKNYAAGERKEFINLIIRSAKVSFFLLFLLALPLYLNCDFVLGIWLKSVPPFSVQFVKLTLIYSLIDCINGPLWMSIQATGKIAAYQIIVSVLIMLNLPLSIIAFLLGAGAEWILYIRIFLAVIITLWRVFFLQKRIGICAAEFLLSVAGRGGIIGFISFVSNYFIWKLLSFNTLVQFFLSCLSTVMVSGGLIFFIGFSNAERQRIVKFIKMKFCKRNCVKE